MCEKEQAREAASPAFNRAPNFTNETTLITILKSELLADIIKIFHFYQIKDDVESGRMKLVAKYNFDQFHHLTHFLSSCILLFHGIDYLILH